MNPKQLIVLVLALGVIVAAYFLMGSDRPQIDQQKVQAQGKAVWGAFNRAGVDSIQLVKGGERVLLKKKNADWVLASREERRVKVDLVAKLLDSIEFAQLESEREGSLESFGLDDAQRTQVQLFDSAGKPLADFFLGFSPEWNRSFIQMPADKKILVVDKNFSDAVQITTANDKKVLSTELWYDLKVLSFKIDDAEELTVERDAEFVHLAKRPPAPPPADPKKKEPVRSKWAITQPKEEDANDQEVLGILTTAAWLSAAGYADDIPANARGLEKPFAKVSVKLKDGTEYKLTIGNALADKAVLVIAGRPEVWKIERIAVDNLAKPLARLRKEASKVDVQPQPAEPVVKPPVVPTETPVVIPHKTEPVARPDKKYPGPAAPEPGGNPAH